MGSKKQGQLTRPPQWWKHLKDFKRIFWKKERGAEKREIRRETEE